MLFSLYAARPCPPALATLRAVPIRAVPIHAMPIRALPIRGNGYASALALTVLFAACAQHPVAPAARPKTPPLPAAEGSARAPIATATGERGESGRAAAIGHWQPIFNGKSLQGWTPKVAGYPAGENFNDTFRVQDGKLVVSYDQYSEFQGAFGHLFYNEKLSHYRIRLQYRFVGEQAKGAPPWGERNNGILVHAEAPGSMRLDQWFPVSIESRLVGGLGKGERRTGSMCSPGTHVVIDGQLVTEHCVDSTAPTIEGDEWVDAEVEVCGNDRIRHSINGQVVLELSHPQLDEGDEDGKRLLQSVDRALHEGYIALQAESQPTEFRNIELMQLDACAD